MPDGTLMQTGGDFEGVRKVRYLANPFHTTPLHFLLSLSEYAM